MRKVDIHSFNVEYMVPEDGQIHLIPLNLDSMCESDLATAMKHPALHELVRKYAQLKLVAIDCRKDGKVDDALKIERKLDNLYDILPEKTKW